MEDSGKSAGECKCADRSAGNAIQIYKRAWTDYFGRYRENFEHKAAQGAGDSKGDGKEECHPESRGGAENKVYPDLRLISFFMKMKQDKGRIFSNCILYTIISLPYNNKIHIENHACPGRKIRSGQIMSFQEEDIEYAG